jgi:U3 small nucleolar RNA-associated protein 12
MIRVFDYKTLALVIVLNGHKKQVSSMAYDKSGTRIASGSRDTDIIIWDVVAESGLVRLRGHKDEVTDVAFVEGRPRAELPPVNGAASGAHGSAGGEPSGGTAAAAGGRKRKRAGSASHPNTASDAFPSPAEAESVSGPPVTLLVTCSKDTLLKVWDLAGRTCVQTIVGARAEVWSLAYLQRNAASGWGDRVVACPGNDRLQMWAVVAPATHVHPAGAGAGAGLITSDSAAAADADAYPYLVPMGEVARQSHERAMRVRGAGGVAGDLVAIQPAGETDVT